ncbi:MAG: glycosyltransferase [Ferruginibacter sp.]
MVAPLDWGLGHATRCIPLIKLLLGQGADVLIAAEEPITTLLQAEFPAILILPLKGYRIRYSSGKAMFVMKMLAQLPGIIYSLKYEKQWLNHIIDKHKIDAVISDNRFSLYTKKTPCVFITHQLFIQAGNKILNSIAQKINYNFINKFNECWVADAEGSNNLAGKLSHPDILPFTPVKYLGILTRCKKVEEEKNIELLIMLSGPEPQRTIFEKILLSQLKNMYGPVVFLRGLPAAHNQLIPDNKNISILNHLPAAALNECIQRSKLVLARCGYSTVMDLVALNQKAILVPTPGQTEQEYLADYLQEKKIFLKAKQHNFSLEKEIQNAGTFNFASVKHIPLLNENIIIDWLAKLTVAGEQEQKI